MILGKYPSMRSWFSYALIILVVICTGCLETGDPSSPADTCNKRTLKGFDTLVGDFAPMMAGNEWVYLDSSYDYVTRSHPGDPVTRSFLSISRWGYVALRLSDTRCAEGNLQHTFHFRFEGEYRKTETNYSIPARDSVWKDIHEDSLYCRDNGAQISCEGLDSADALYASLFRFHRVPPSNLKNGVNPLTGLTAAKAVSGFGGRYWKDVGVVETREETDYSWGGCCSTGNGQSASLTRFNGDTATYR
jgi:hypothetical protein